MRSRYDKTAQKDLAERRVEVVQSSGYKTSNLRLSTYPSEPSENVDVRALGAQLDQYIKCGGNSDSITVFPQLHGYHTLVNTDNGKAITLSEAQIEGMRRKGYAGLDGLQFVEHIYQVLPKS